MIIIIYLIAFPSQLKKQIILIIRLLIRDRYKGPLEQNIPLISFLWDLIMYQVSSIFKV